MNTELPRARSRSIDPTALAALFAITG